MKKDFRCLSCAVSLLLLCAVMPRPARAEQAAGKEKEIPNIIIITLSGVSNRESIDDPTHQYISHLWNRIIPNGVLYTNLVDLNFQFHMPAVYAINTGENYDFYDLHNPPQIRTPSFFQYARKQFDLPEEKAWIIGRWYMSNVYTDDTFTEETLPAYLTIRGFKMSPLLSDILSRQEQAFVKTFRPLSEQSRTTQWPQWDSLGTVQFSLFKKIMRTYHPKLVHLVLNDVEVAHFDTFAKYAFALKRSDEKMGEIWEYIHSSPHYKENTYLFITVDHERNDYYMHHHEAALNDSPPVWLFMYGPDIREGTVIDRRIHHIDIFKTVADIIGIETHPTNGRFLREAFIKKK